ncbi:MAG: AraC family transcriptional regulator [Cyclobacteriaceae bacterium]
MQSLNRVKHFQPEINKVYFINQYTLLHILGGSGAIQVDFKNYLDWNDKLIYLEKGQYIKFLSDDFSIRRIEFNDQEIFGNKDIRVLFKHLLSLGYINFDTCEDCQRYLSQTALSESVSNILDISSKQWYWQNPFHAAQEEYHVIFDIKEVIDSQFNNHLTNQQLSALINENGFSTQHLVKDKLGLSMKQMLTKRRLLESRRELAFSDKGIKEISYDLGYNDPAYFNRVFKNETGGNPSDFRQNFDFEQRDTFISNILELLKEHHTHTRNLDFYADKMNMSVKTLSKKVKDKLNLSLGQLIRFEIVNSAKQKLLNGATIKEVAFELRFEEANHFSSFFKQYTGNTPTEFLGKKYK